MSMAPIKTSWDLSPLFASDDDPGILAEREKMEEEVGKFVSKIQRSFQNRLGSTSIWSKIMEKMESRGSIFLCERRWTSWTQRFGVRKIRRLILDEG